MLSLLAAAAAAAATATPAGMPASRMPNAYDVPAHCRDARQNVVDRYGRPVTLPLGQAARGAMMLAVDRRVNGCPVITVGGRLQPAPDRPNPPVSEYRMLPLKPDRP
jgi:hypothetical protein